MFTTYLTLGIFILAFIVIIFELFDSALVAMTGALLMVIVGILTPEEAVAAIEFDAIFLLMGMMIVVNIASKSGIFDWVNVKIASLTRGNPLAIFLFFSLLTGVCSSFLDNVTTVILVVPLTIELLRGMGKDPKPYIFGEIMFANIGGALTLIGDPSNIIIGSATGLTFMQFINNLWIPVLSVSIFVLLVSIMINWKNLKPISSDLTDLFVANIIIRKIKVKFLKVTLHRSFVIKVVAVLVLTVAGFVLQGVLGMPAYVIAFVAAIVLAVLCSKRVHIHDSLKSVEWTTLLFFAGLFIMVAGLVKTGLLMQMSQWIANSTSNLLYLSLIILWACGFVSMIINTVPFITVMVPVIVGIQGTLDPSVDSTVLWWALSMGACLGGVGTLIGGSANVVSAGLARREGVAISFLEYAKFGVPIAIGMLLISSVYLFFRIS